MRRQFLKSLPDEEDSFNDSSDESSEEETQTQSTDRVKRGLAGIIFLSLRSVQEAITS